MSAEPVAWKIEFRRDGMLERRIFSHNAVADYRCIDPDATSMPLYASSPAQARALAIAECASMVERWEATYDGADSDLSLLADDMRSLSPAPSVTEEWVEKIAWAEFEGYEARNAERAVRATLAALGVTVEGAAK